MKDISIPGKIPTAQIWCLEIEYRVGLAHRGEIIDESHPPAMAAINLHVGYDDRTLVNQQITNTGRVTCEIADDKELLHHQLCIGISKDEAHTARHNGVEPGICVACDVFVDTVPVTGLITGGGSLVLDDSEQKAFFALETPIYRWLLKRFNAIYHRPEDFDPMGQIMQFRP